MIYIGSIISNIDNSGIKSLKLIQGFKLKKISLLICNFVPTIIKTNTIKCTLDKKKVYFCMICITSYWQKNHETGIFIKCKNLCGISFDTNKKPLFSKINSSVPRFNIYLLKKKNLIYQKLLKYIKTIL